MHAYRAECLSSKICGHSLTLKLGEHHLNARDYLPASKTLQNVAATISASWADSGARKSRKKKGQISQAQT